MKKYIAILMAVCVTFMLNGCATSSLPLEKIPYQDLESRNENGYKVKKDYTLGLALAGGGTKASSFSMGVLEGLSETEIINQTDAISSVSGGGYAALWFYSRLLNPENQKLLENRHGLNNKILTFFQDCFAIRYSESFGTQLTETCPDKDTFFVVSEPNNIDPFRHQNYIRGYQDIFSSGTDALGNPAFNMESTGNNKRLSNDIFQLTAKTLGATVINFIPNILFDWEVPLSPSRAAYKKGIIRTYGAKVDECIAKEFCDKTRKEGDTKWVSNQLKFDKLREAYKTGEVPLWIINTTAGENRGLLDFSPQSSFTFTSYEMTPFGSGSGIYGYHKFDDTNYLNKLPPEEKVGEAVIMSAAFFDEQQKVIGTKFNWLINPIQSLFTLNWGYSRSNPQVSSTKRNVHKLLPWPIYYLHGFNGQDSVNIRFSDGGQSENSGAYALIRRKISDIIISDHSQDRGGQMADICLLKNNLEKMAKEPLYLHVPALYNFQEVCSDQEVKKGYKLGYNIFEWNHPILLGCISKINDKNSCTQDEYVTNRLYIIKPAIPKSGDHYTKIGNHLTQDIIDIKVPKCNQLKSGTPYSKELDSNHWEYEEEVPCELVGFWNNNAHKDDNGLNKNDKYPHFPQHTTVGLTLNSSNWIYGASRELARYYSRQLFWFFGIEANKDSIKRKFKLVLEKQASDSMKPKLTKQRILGSDVAKDKHDQ